MRISDWSSDVCSSDLTDALLSQPLVQTAAGGDQPLGEGSSFAAGLSLSGPDGPSGLGASIVPTGTLGGVEISGFGLMADDDGFTFFLPPVVEGEAPAINVVYLIDFSSSMGRASDGGAASPSSPSRLDLAQQALQIGRA